MRAALAHRAQRLRSNSLTTVPPPHTSDEYSDYYASIAASIFYRSPLPSESGLPIYVLNAAAFPDSFEVDYDALLPYVLARLPEEDELIAGAEYEVIFFAGGQPDNATSEKRNGPGLGWYLQAYNVLSRATRKRVNRLWVVHERSWVRVLIEVFGTIVSPKFKKKIVHISTLSGLALHFPIETLLIPPSVYLHDRRIAQDIYAPAVGGKRSFAADEPLPKDYHGQRRLPRVLRETTSFLCLGDNLKTEGLFRIPPQSQLLGILREAYNRKQQFIIWKERSTSYAQPGVDADTIAEIPHAEAYGVHLAAGLIKVWYRELKSPIFPDTSYSGVRAVNSDLSQENLMALISPTSETSMLSRAARLILTSHLLPLLSLVASFETSNKMSAENLAICFAPALLRGPDPMQDAKMSQIIKSILEAAIEAWPLGLAQKLGVRPKDFAREIQPPQNPADYEDPLYEQVMPSAVPSSRPQPPQPQLIIPHDSRPAVTKPQLPPRPTSQPRHDVAESPSTSPRPKRKPAPPVAGSPRNSSVVDVDSQVVTASPISTADSAVDFKHTPGLGLSFDSADKSRTDTQGGLVLPRHRDPSAVETSQIIKQPHRTASDPPKEPARSRAGSDAIRRKPVSPAAAPTLSEITTQSAQLRSVSGDSVKSVDESMFVKPTWAASSRQTSGASVSANVTPQRRVSPPFTSALQSPSPGLAAPPQYLPKPRTPSPGLLQRMTSMELDRSLANKTLQPHRLDLKQQSVDDLRKLYEERAGTMARLESAVRMASET